MCMVVWKVKKNLIPSYPHCHTQLPHYNYYCENSICSAPPADRLFLSVWIGIFGVSELKLKCVKQKESYGKWKCKGIVWLQCKWKGWAFVQVRALFHFFRVKKKNRRASVFSFFSYTRLTTETVMWSNNWSRRLRMQMKDGHVESWKEQEKRVSIRVTMFRKSWRKRNLARSDKVGSNFSIRRFQKDWPPEWYDVGL